MVNDSEARKIMAKPLPQILEEIEGRIRLADEAARDAREADWKPAKPEKKPPKKPSEL